MSAAEARSLKSGGNRSEALNYRAHFWLSKMRPIVQCLSTAAAE